MSNIGKSNGGSNVPPITSLAATRAIHKDTPKKPRPNLVLRKSKPKDEDDKQRIIDEYV